MASYKSIYFFFKPTPASRTKDDWFTLSMTAFKHIAPQTQEGAENIRPELKRILNSLLIQKDYVDKTSSISVEGIIQNPRQEVNCRGRPAQKRKKGHEEITIRKLTMLRSNALFFC